MHESLNNEKSLFEGSKWELPTNIDLVELAEEELGRRLAEAGWVESVSEDKNDAGILKVGFREALINAIAHGNLDVVKPDDGEKTLDSAVREKQNLGPTNKKVYVELDITPDRVSITIKDEGKGFDWKNLPNPVDGENVFKTKGRGILFMNSFFDSVTYNDLGNEVTMVKIRS